MALRRVVFHWNDLYGECYECGNPAAYTSDEHESWPENLRCAVCAAQDASRGAKIVWLYEEAH